MQDDSEIKGVSTPALCFRSSELQWVSFCCHLANLVVMLYGTSWTHKLLDQLVFWYFDIMQGRNTGSEEWRNFSEWKCGRINNTLISKKYPPAISDEGLRWSPCLPHMVYIQQERKDIDWFSSFTWQIQYIHISQIPEDDIPWYGLVLETVNTSLWLPSRTWFQVYLLYYR